jgi:hypothetical protein
MMIYQCVSIKHFQGGIVANAALANLHDIHLPKPIGWWPLANGWYLLLALITTSFIIGGMCWYRYHCYQRPKRHALQLLKQYEQQYQHDNDSISASAMVSELLKRVALVYFPRFEVAYLTDDAWLNFLNNTGKQPYFTDTRELLRLLPYQKKAVATDLTPLFKSAYAWIKQRGKPCSN